MILVQCVEINAKWRGAGKRIPGPILGEICILLDQPAPGYIRLVEYGEQVAYDATRFTILVTDPPPAFITDFPVEELQKLKEKFGS
jgi:hypothetical protein